MKEQAAADIAAGEFRPSVIASRACVSAGALSQWRAHPEFIARVEELVAAFREEARYVAIAQKERRILAMNERWLGIHQVIAERGAHEDFQQVPGGRTGILARDIKQVGSGENAQIVTIYSVDTGLLKEAREIEKAAAIEMGQLVEKKEITGQGGGPLQMQAAHIASVLLPEELETIRQRLIAARGVEAPVDVELAPAEVEPSV